MANTLKADFKSIKLMPTLLAIMLGAGVLNMILGLLIMTDNGFYLASELFRFLSVLGVYICAYRLTGIFKEFAYTNVFFAIYVFFTLSIKIVTWLGQFPIDKLLLGISLYVFYVISELAIMFGINFLLLGIAKKYEEMDGGKAHPEAEKTRRIWITTQILIMVIGGILLPIYTGIYDYLPLGKIGMVIILSLGYLAAVVYICIQVYRFCFQYYIYLYNGPKGGMVRR